MDRPALERRYDGPIPAADPAAPPPPPVALLARLLREGRERLGRRRLTLAPGHPRLEMAAADIGAYRHGLVRGLPTGPAAGGGGQAASSVAAQTRLRPARLPR